DGIRDYKVTGVQTCALPISSEYCQVRVGGDAAVLKGIMKLVLDAHVEALRNGAAPVLDLAFIEQHTHGFDAFADDLRRTSWDDRSEERRVGKEWRYRWRRKK